MIHKEISSKAKITLIMTKVSKQYLLDMTIDNFKFYHIKLSKEFSSIFIYSENEFDSNKLLQRSI